MLFGHLSVVKEDLKCNRIQIWRTLSTLQNDLLEISDKMCQSCKSGEITERSQEKDHCVKRPFPGMCPSPKKKKLFC